MTTTDNTIETKLHVPFLIYQPTMPQRYHIMFRTLRCRIFSILGICLFLAVLQYILYPGSLEGQKPVHLSKLTLDKHNGHLLIQSHPATHPAQSSSALKGHLGQGDGGFWSWIAGTNIWSDVKIKQSEDNVVMTFPEKAKLTISYKVHKNPNRPGETLCYQITWVSLSRDFVPLDCFAIDGDEHWYGGAEVLTDRWSIKKAPIKMQNFLSNDIGMVLDGYGNVLERYWLSSKGISVVVEEHVPLHVGIQPNRLCFKAQYENSAYKNIHGVKTILNYSICSSKNVLEAHLFVAARMFTPSIQIPDSSLFERPVWSTWAKFKTDINEESVIKYVSLIKQHKFKGCQIEIDDGYSTAYGDSHFDPKKFPTPLKMSRWLKEQGFNITVWVTPFVNTDSENYKEVLDRRYFVDSKGQGHLIEWWRGKGGVVDVTNPEGISWMKKRLDTLKSEGVTSFKFDAGETNFLPQDFITHIPLENPNHFSRLFAIHMVNLTGNRILEVRVGYRSQHLPVMVRMMDKDSVWGYQRGLQTLIPTALVFGILGYPYVLPDMIGGNGWAGGVKTEPDKELYLRWIGATIFLPFLQFSIPPWDYDNETIEITHKLLSFRDKFLADIKKAARQSAVTAHPMIKPLWWVDPDDPKTFDIDSEFLLGDNLLVAPVLKQGVKARDIYLPKGLWTDVKNGGEIKGPVNLEDYAVSLDQVPVFRLVPPNY